jgi:hypothetical protein
VQHATPGEVLVCQIDERYLNRRVGLKAHGIDAESAGTADGNWPPFNFMSGLPGTGRLEIQIMPSCANLGSFPGTASLAASFLCSMPFDETARGYVRCRVYNSHRDE